MKYNLCALCLFYIFTFVLNSSVVKEYQDEKEENIDINDEDIYAGIRLPKDGFVNVLFKTEQKLEKSNFKYGLSPSLDKNGISFSDDFVFTHIDDTYSMTFDVKKENNEFAIVHIGNLKTGGSAKIKLDFYTNREGWIIAIVVLAIILFVLIVIICICKKCLRCCR